MARGHIWNKKCIRSVSERVGKPRRKPDKEGGQLKKRRTGRQGKSTVVQNWGTQLDGEKKSCPWHPFVMVQ